MVLFLKNLLFTVLVPGTAAVLLPYAIATRAGALSDVALARPLLAAPFFILGAAVYFWCLRDFAVAGRGTPAPIDPPKHLVVRGLYRYVRNPMYLGVLMVIAGWAILSRSAAMSWYGATLGITMHLFVVLIEEPMLRRRFGDVYEAYCAAVRRWVPGRGRRQTLN